MVRRFEKKFKKYLGNRTHGAGNTKNRRGKGNRGGVGRAGLHKHKWFQKIKTEGTIAPKGFHSVKKKYGSAAATTLEKISEEIKNGKWPKQGEFYEVNLLGKNIKVLGNGFLEFKTRVLADSFSAGARQKIVAGGGIASTASKIIEEKVSGVK